MNTALQAIVVPALRASGFKGFLPHFRRITASHIHLLTFQFDRYGGGFVIEAAIAPNQPFKTRWGQTIAPYQLNAHDLDARCRIHPDGILDNSSTDDWYLLFNSAGAIMKGLDHESAMFTFHTPPAGIYDDVPEAFQPFLKEPAFDIENESFCIWRTFQDASWRVGNVAFPAGRDPDGSAGLLAIRRRWWPS